MVGHGWTWLDMVGHGWTWLDMVGHGWTWLDMVGHGWTWVDMVGHGWTLPFHEKIAFSLRHGWTWVDMVGHCLFMKRLLFPSGMSLCPMSPNVLPNVRVHVLFMSVSVSVSVPCPCPLMFLCPMSPNVLPNVRVHVLFMSVSVSVPCPCPLMSLCPMSPNVLLPNVRVHVGRGLFFPQKITKDMSRLTRQTNENQRHTYNTYTEVLPHGLSMAMAGVSTTASPWARP
jgi:hypothetical protein